MLEIRAMKAVNGVVIREVFIEILFLLKSMIKQKFAIGGYRKEKSLGLAARQ